jgi:hypothetical protein
MAIATRTTTKNIDPASFYELAGTKTYSFSSRVVLMLLFPGGTMMNAGVSKISPACPSLGFN